MKRPFPAYEGTEPFIFVCYAHDDAEVVYSEITRLRDADFRIWYDEGIAPGSEWSAAIAERIQRCRVFLYFVTPESVKREHCRRELTFAMEQPCSILAVHLEPTELPPALQLSLSNRQAIISGEHSAQTYRSKLDQSLRAALGHSAESGKVDQTASPNARSGRWSIVLVAAALLLVVLGGLVVHDGGTPATQTDTETHEQVGIGDAVTMLAVAPFEDSSPDANMQWLARGLAAQLRNELAQLEGLTVVPAAVPNAALLGGTVQAYGDEVVVVMEMTDPSSGKTLWTQEFTGSADDPMEMQDRVLLQIVRVLERRLVGDATSQPRGRAAQIAWLRSLAQGWGGDPVTQRYWLERVIAEDPQFAPAYLAIFWPYVQSARAYADPVWVEKAAEALDRAAELGLGEVWQWHFANGAYLWQFAGEFEQAEGHLRSGISAGGNAMQYAALMSASGLVREARDYFEQAVASQPYLPTLWIVLSAARALEGDVAGAHDAGLQAARLLPPDAIVGRNAQVWMLPELGRLEEAEEHLDFLRDEFVRLQRFPELRLNTLLLEFDLAVARGERDRALDLAATLESEGWHQTAGILYLTLDDERATRALEAGSQPPFYRINNLQFHLRRLSPDQREDPRIRRALDAMGFTHEWRLELCRRASTLPQEIGLTCDPGRYI